ncbi:MAG: zf-HC2 domain-containing protein [Ruthenibacterium sp.]
MTESGLPCAVCRDLIPLVRDGVASEESDQLVHQHIAACDDCKRFMAGAETRTEPDDTRVIGRMKRKISLWLVCVVTCSLMFGVALTFSTHSLLAILVFPLCCGIAYWFDSFVWKLVPPIAFAMLFIIVLLQHGYGTPIRQFMGALRSGIFVAALCAVGALAAALLKYGFSKGEKNDENQNKT